MKRVYTIPVHVAFVCRMAMIALGNSPHGLPRTATESRKLPKHYDGYLY